MTVWKARLNACVKAGNVISALVALVGFPAVAIGALFYSQELWDRVTPPDVAVEAPLLSIRCAYVFRYGEPSDLRLACDKAPVAISAGSILQSDDTVPRVMTAVSAVLTLPDGRQLDLRLGREVTHEVWGGQDSHVRRELAPISLSPRGVAQREFWIEPAQTSGKNVMRWAEFERMLVDHAMATNPMGLTLKLHGQFRSQKEMQPLLTCTLEFPPDKIQRYFKESTRIQITTTCIEGGAAPPTVRRSRGRHR